MNQSQTGALARGALANSQFDFRVNKTRCFLQDNPEHEALSTTFPPCTPSLEVT